MLAVIYAAAAIAKAADAPLEDAVREFVHFFLHVDTHERPESDA